MKDRRTRWAIDWGHLALLLFISLVVLAYLLDARATSLKLNNLLFVEPVAIIALILVALVLPQCFRRLGSADAGHPPAQATSLSELGKAGALAAGFGAFALSLESAGFDVATFLFTAFGLYICGERKLWLIGVFSAIFTACIIYGYQMLVPFPFPLTVL